MSRYLQRRPCVFSVVASTLLASLVLSLPMPAFARGGVCYSGGQFLPNFTLNGDGTLNGTDILVTKSTGWARSSVMYDTPLSTAKDFHIEFVVKISLNTKEGGADGMAFIMHNNGAGATALGTAGQGMGYQGISPSIVVEFDTFENLYSAGDTNDNHVAITKNGDPNHASTTNAELPVNDDPGVDLKSGSNVYVWIDYIASSTTLDVYLAVSDNKPTTTTLTTASLDVVDVLGEQMYIGFTGSTGDVFSQHEIVELYASDEGQADDGCCKTDADCAANALGPVCDPIKKICGPCSLLDDGTCEQPAACDVSKAINTCTAECNGNYGSGTTQACTSPNFQACSVSGPTAGNCAMCNGDFASTPELAIRCPEGAPTCLKEGFCGLCQRDADCTEGIWNAGGLCNLATGQCYCSANADCTKSLAGPTCTAGVCGCTDDSECGAGNYCKNGGCIRRSCQSDGDCESPQFCDATSFVCVDDLAAGVSLPMDALHSGKCISSLSTTVCESAKCNATTDSCANADGEACSENNQCVSNVCDSGVCQASAEPAASKSGGCSVSTTPERSAVHGALLALLGLTVLCRRRSK